VAEKGRWGTSPVRGHDDKWNLLMEKEAPSRMHFLGPEGVGRKKFAKDWHLTNNGGTADQEYAYDPTPTPSTVAALRQFAMLPPKNRFRTAVIELADHVPSGTTSAIKALLDDETPAKIILISEHELPEVLASRVVTFRFEPLSDDDIRAVLRDLSFQPERIERALRVAQGSVARAKAARAYVRDQETVLRLLDGIVEHDVRAITSLRKNWTRHNTAALRKWLQESLTGQWEHFHANDDRPITRPAKMALLKATSKQSQGQFAEVRLTAEDLARGGTGA